MRVVCSIAGSDSSGGAGIQADLKAIAACGAYGATVITAITAQNTRGVQSVHALPVEVVEAQLDAVFDDLQVAAVKTGMLSNPAVVESVARALRRRAPLPLPLVVDPVMVSKSGHALLRSEAVASLRQALLPLATLVTPNRHEAEALTGVPVTDVATAQVAARILLAQGCHAVLVKGGHFDSHTATDVLVSAAGTAVFEAPRIDTPHTHGTGCTLAAAIASFLARGDDLAAAVRRAKSYVTEAIRAGIALGAGQGPTDHFFYLRRTDPEAWLRVLGLPEPGGAG